MASNMTPVLASRVAAALPAGPRLIVHHLSASPAACTELFSAPPEQAPELTTCEPHFLSVSLEHNGRLVQIFAIEVLIYVTESLTTLFVSKADSTGYFYLGQQDGKTPSPSKAIVSSFLEYLIDLKKRVDTRLVVSLFARSQNQYLFPGSIENPYKHVLDDRALIRWWSMILDTILSDHSTNRLPTPLSTRGHLVVPGCDNYETRAFLPRPPADAKNACARWCPGDPLRTLGKPAGVPERCLIPRFPDDPKSRFVTNLDDELPDASDTGTQGSPSRSQPGRWRSVRSLAQFWELMAFRQECGAGRVVGFLWGVFEPLALVDRPFEARVRESDSPEKSGQEEEQEQEQDLDLPTPQASPAQPLSAAATEDAELPSTRSLLSDTFASALLSPPASSQVQSSQVTEAVAAAATSDTAETPQPPRDLSTTASPPSSELVISPEAYARTMVLLDSLDYADAAAATNSTATFLATVATEAAVKSPWSGVEVVGTRDYRDQPNQPRRSAEAPRDAGGKESKMVILGGGMIRKKRRATNGEDEMPASGTTTDRLDAGKEQQPKFLAGGLVRKKPKV